MSHIFVVKNQNGLYLNKQQEWTDGAEAQSLFRTAHKDEAINTVFEVSSRDIYLRAEALACAVNDKGLPVVEIAVQPPVQESFDEIGSDPLAEEISAESADA